MSLSGKNIGDVAGQMDSPSSFRTLPRGNAMSGNPEYIRDQAPESQRSLRGILADLRSSISADDIRDARTELWSGLGHGES